jgi:xanthine dehydrogenase accessory factor
LKEIRTIIDVYDKINKSDVGAALATVVKVEGSSYRRTGARMLVQDDGMWTGGISGGCLEGDALNKARLAIINSRASVVTYDTTQADEHEIGVGLGCNGIIEVLFTPLDFNDKNNPVEVLKTCMNRSRETHLLINIIELKGEWANVNAGQVIPYYAPKDLDIFGDSELKKILADIITHQIESGVSAPHVLFTENGKKCSVFVEVLFPEIQLILMGHQYDVYPLASLAQEMGWRVTIASSPLKIKSGVMKRTINICKYEQLNELPIDKETAILLMSHDYKTDKMNLSRALLTEAGYIGMLGPRVRAEKIFNELGNEGSRVADEEMERIYGPAGLDIGATSPEEIALSLLAEIKTAFSGRDGGFLRLRKTTIHERD